MEVEVIISEGDISMQQPPIKNQSTALAAGFLIFNELPMKSPQSRGSQ